MQHDLTLRLARGRGKEFTGGFPWLFKGDFVESSEQVLCTPGCIARVEDAKGKFLALGTFCTSSPIPFRELTRREEAIDEAFLLKRLQAALQKRGSLYTDPYYRLVHSEGDGLPGLIIDRFDQTLVCQISTAGMEALWPQIKPPLEKLLSPHAILLRNDIPAREREGLARFVKTEKGSIAPRITLIENNCRYVADLLHGQKTGWFFDQRDNRAYIASLAKGKTLLDVFSHSGGFGVLAALQGAHATMVDSSALALELAAEAVRLNDVSARCEFLRSDAAAALEKLAAAKKQFDVVTLDPPAMVKSPKDLAAGLKGYEKLVKLGAPLVKEGGALYVASCSHRATRPMFEKAVMQGLAKAGRKGTIIHRLGASADHPVHAHLRQNEYLKSVTLRLN